MRSADFRLAHDPATNDAQGKVLRSQHRISTELFATEHEF